jgi:hypothetical protein
MSVTHKKPFLPRGSKSLIGRRVAYVMVVLLAAPACVDLTPPWTNAFRTGGISNTGGLVSNGGVQMNGGATAAGGKVGGAGMTTGLGGRTTGGGTMNAGGTVGSGGTTSTGGAAGGAGIPSSGGTPSSAGTASSGGRSSSGGGPGSGGTASSAGKTSNGGRISSDGGAAIGGFTSNGGVAAEGGGIATRGGAGNSGNTQLDAGTVDASAQLVNLSLGKPVTASSQQSGKEATRGNDGSTATSFCPNGNALPSWWRVDLGAVYLLAKLDVNFEKPNSYYKYKIEVSSDDTQWTIVVDQTNNTTRNGVTLTDTLGVQGRYVRITIVAISTNDWGCFWELTVWG